MRKIWYPTQEDAEKANKLAVEVFRATKAEKFEVKNPSRIKDAINRCQRRKGKIEQKAACILKGFSDAHGFGSANRRTGYILMNEFLWKNRGYAIAKKKKFTERLFKELRLRDVKEKEILDWYKRNKKFI